MAGDAATRPGVADPGRPRVPTIVSCRDTRVPRVGRQRRREAPMHLEDLILVSVDDHVVEPPDMFEGRLPARFADQAPRVDAPRGRHRDLALRRQGGHQHRAERGGRPADRGVRHRAHLVRRDPLGLLRHPRPGPGHGRQRRDRLDVLPVVPQPLRAALRQGDGPRPRPGRAAGLQRLAHRRVVRHLSRVASSPSALPPIWDPDAMAAEVRRVAAKGCHAVTFSENPVQAEAAQLPQRPLGPVLVGVLATRGPSCACTSGRRRRSW